MGTPWGCPTTGATPSVRKHSVSSRGRRWWRWWAWLSSLGVSPSRERGHHMGWPPCTHPTGHRTHLHRRPHPLHHKQPKFTPHYPQQRAEPGYEQGVLSALVTAPGTSCLPGA